MERNQLHVLLIQNFNKNLFETLKPFETIDEKVEYLETLTELLKGIYNSEEPIPAIDYEGNPFDTTGFIRKNILLKYKHKAKPFSDTNLRLYFEKDPVIRKALFILLKINEELLNEEELKDYFSFLLIILNNIIEKVCTQTIETAKTETEKEIKNLPETNAGITNAFKASNPEYTRIRQALMLHYWFKAMGLDKETLKRRKLAEFAHALFMWPMDDIDNSGLYKMLRQAPFLKENDKNMLKDLEFVKAQFQLVNIPGTVELVEREIKSIKNG